MTPLAAVLVGLLAGTHAASWGAYKDSPFEGFRLASFMRSIIVGFAAALAVGYWSWSSPGAPLRLVVAVGVVYGLERLGTEWWKAFVRNDDQGAYTIPMRFAVAGKPVDNRRVRYMTAAAIGFGIVGGMVGVATAQHALPHAPAWIVVCTVGALGGWATAIGGAWKDAPIEGFSGWKFLRSPTVATSWALPVSLLTANWCVMLLASSGFAVIAIETYKTFFTGGRPPGKFAGRPSAHKCSVLRERLRRVHAALWAILAMCLLESTPGRASVGSPPALVSIPWPLLDVVLTAMAGCAALVAVLVLCSSTSSARLGSLPSVGRGLWTLVTARYATQGATPRPLREPSA
jgi:hypothetical protein